MLLSALFTMMPPTNLTRLSTEVEAGQVDLLEIANCSSPTDTCVAGPSTKPMPKMCSKSASAIEAQTTLPVANSGSQPHPSGKLPPCSSSLGHLGSPAPVILNALISHQYVSTDSANTVGVLSLHYLSISGDPDQIEADLPVQHKSPDFETACVKNIPPARSAAARITRFRASGSPTKRERDNSTSHIKSQRRNSIPP